MIVMSIPRTRRVKNKEYKEIALERINILFREADAVFHEDRTLANRYVQLARKIGMKLNVVIPKELKPRFCRKCGEFLVYGVNAKHRLDTTQKIVIYTCLACGNERKVPYGLEKGKNKKESVDS